jgi:hypothetical protein
VLRATQIQALTDIAAAFGYSTPVDDGRDDAPRDVLWCPSDIALRRRAEQSSRLSRAPESHMPFMSFWRPDVKWNTQRANTPLARDGALTGDARTYIYQMRPVDVYLQVDHWSRKHTDHEAAIENYFRWSAPPTQMSLTDDAGVVFNLPMWFGEGTDNSQIMKVYDLGEIYRWTFTFWVGSYVVTGSSSFALIETVKTRWLDYGATGETEDAVLIKAVDLVE